MISRLLTALPVAACVLFGGIAVAEANPADVGSLSEARERFDRGLTLFNQGDNEGALAEFQRAYELTENPVVLYNVARVQVAASDPVAALETIDRLLAPGVELSATRRAELEVLRAEQQRNVGAIAIDTISAIAGARVEVDGVDRGALEPKQPLQLASGRHVVGVSAPGFLPLRRTVLLAGQEQKKLEFALEPAPAPLGRLKFAVQPIGVAVIVDGQELGRTPGLLETAIAPGTHRLELRRPGYRVVARDLFVPAVALIKVSEALSFDVTSDEPSSRLQVQISETNAVVRVDGRLMSAAGELAMPEGEHLLHVEHAGFFPVERRIVLRRGVPTQIVVTLAPTASTRADYAASVSTRRAWAWGLGLGGTVVAGAGVGYLLWNRGQIAHAEQAFDGAFHKADSACRPAATIECDPLRNVANIRAQDLAGKRDRQTVGWLGVGLGVAALGTGLTLGLTGPDPHRYEPRPASDVFGSLWLRPWVTPFAAGALFGGRM